MNKSIPKARFHQKGSLFLLDFIENFEEIYQQLALLKKLEQK
jgi:hypothetical protein